MEAEWALQNGRSFSDGGTNMAQDDTDSDGMDPVSRRTTLKTAGISGALVGLGGVVVAASRTAHPDRDVAGQDTTTEGTTTINEELPTIILGGEMSHWFGIAPDAIHGKENPTLTLEPGQRYRLVWINVDGAPHEPVIEDADGNVLVTTDPVRTTGLTASVTFEATEEMVEYYCTFHPQNMRSDVVVDGKSNTTTS